jgi:hypothetical protein
LIHRETGEGLQQWFFSDKNLNLFGPRRQKRLQLPGPFFRDEKGDNRKLTFKQTSNNLLAFSDKNPLLPMFHLPAHRAIGLHRGKVEGLDFLEDEQNRNCWLVNRDWKGGLAERRGWIDGFVD